MGPFLAPTSTFEGYRRMAELSTAGTEASTEKNIECLIPHSSFLVEYRFCGCHGADRLNGANQVTCGPIEYLTYLGKV